MTHPAIREGGRIWWPALKMGGGVLRVEGDHAHVLVDKGELLQVSISSGAIVAAPLDVGLQVEEMDGRRGTVLESAPSDDYPSWRVQWTDGSVTVQIERTVRPAAPKDPIECMQSGVLSEPRAFNLRSVAADMWARNTGQELVSLAHARINLQPHQIAVAHRVVSNYPHRFLLCDEVGLGKTIEAALIIKELRARGLAKRVLILTPAGIQRQWQYELKTRFNEVFEIFNRDTLRYLHNNLNVNNPWVERNSVITSHAFASLSEERRAEIAAAPWDLVIVDEAHHARRQRRGKSVTRTLLYQLVHNLTFPPDFARRSVLFLTATPMQLHPHELFSLTEMISPTLFASEDDFNAHLDQRAGLSRIVEKLEQESAKRGEELEARLPTGWLPNAAGFLEWSEDDIRASLDDPAKLSEELRSKHRLSEVMLRNRRASVGGFMPRTAFRWAVQLSDIERLVQREMEAIIREGYQRAEDDHRNAVGFLMVIWQKLLASSSAALRGSLQGRRDRLIKENLDDVLGALDLDEAIDDDQPVSELSAKVGQAVGDEVARLESVISLLDQIGVDSKARALVENLREMFTVEPDGKALIFTQFRGTQDMLRDLLRRESWNVHTFHGQLSAGEKDDAVERFRGGSGPQILISTEAGGEGRNLQFAHHLVNYDLPWNPMRVEQRIGRIDRIGQTHAVSVYNFHLQDTIESRVLEVLDERIHLFESSVGGLEPILGDAEADIRKAMRLSEDARERAFKRLGEQLELKVEKARIAEQQGDDFVLDELSQYTSDIVKATGGSRASTVRQDEFERMIVEMLASVGTDVKESNVRGLQTGEWQIQFHPPFTEEQRDLLGGDETRRVCLDPHIDVDSAQVEYFGFGHPVVDALVERVTQNSQRGAAAVRRIPFMALPTVRPGWQFVWMLQHGGSRSQETVVSTFVDDDGIVDAELGDALLQLSRDFDKREKEGGREAASKAAHTALATFGEARQVAEDFVVRRRNDAVASRQETALARHEIEERRTKRLFDHRRQAAEDRRLRDRETLRRMQASSDPAQRAVIPIWEANVRRAEVELERIDVDRDEALRALAQTLDPKVEYLLLCVARIVPAV